MPAASRAPKQKFFLHWLELALLIVLAAGVMVLINSIAYRHNSRYDLTPEKTFSLSPQTLRVLETLSDPLRVTVFFKEDDRQRLFDLMELFKRASRHIDFTLLDLDKNPAKAEALGIQSFGAGFLVYRGKKEKIPYFSEEYMVSAIIRLTEKNLKVVRFVSGHGEKDINNPKNENSYTVIRSALESENFQTAELVLLQADAVPENTLVLIINGPQKDFLKQELVMIEDFLRKGGQVLFLCDPVPLPNIEQFLAGYHITLARDFIIDTKSKLFGLDNLTPIIIPDKKHPVAEYMNEAAVFPYCRSVMPSEERNDTKRVYVLAESGPDSWAERDTQSVYEGSVGFDSARDIPGPVPVALVAALQPQKQDSPTVAAGQLVVMGDADFASNHYVNILGNKDFFLNTVNWLAGKNSLLAARVQKGQTPVSLLFLTEGESRLVFWSSVVILPAAVFIVGILVTLWRRFRR